MAYTGPVKIREGQIDILINLYKGTYKRLIKDIIDSSDAGKINMARVMARINAELESLGVDVDKWVRREMAQYYLDGANIAQQDLRALGVDITKSQGFAVINKEAIKALTSDVGTAFAESMTAISRSARASLSDAVKNQIRMTIAEGKLTGDARKMISAAVEKNLRENGLSALRDRAGKEWSFENYARMLVRTKGAEARNQGLANRMLASGYDLVQVSDHNSEHQACADLEGEVLSLTGNTPKGTELPGDIVVWGSLEEAQVHGLFHPNCEHAINIIVPELAEKTHAYDNPYNHLDLASKAEADEAFANRNDAVTTP